MVERRIKNRADFLRTYNKNGNKPYVPEMDQWVIEHPKATTSELVKEFEKIIIKARSQGYPVSKHLDFGKARDIRIPIGSDKELELIDKNLRLLGIKTIIPEKQAGTGPHWHIDW